MIRRPRARMAIRVWRRNALAYSKAWRSSMLPPFLDPLFYFVAFGFGLGTYVAQVNGVPYRDFIAPGLCASAVMWAASFEVTFSFFWRMQSGVHQNVISTPVEAEDVVLGELLWAATRAVLYGSSFLLVVAALGYVDSPWAAALPGALFLGGLAFGALGMAFTVLATKVDYYTFYFTLLVNPMFLLGGIFFPVDALPGWAAALAWLTPMSHLVGLARELTIGPDAASVALDALWLMVYVVLIALLPLRRLRQRLVA